MKYSQILKQNREMEKTLSKNNRFTITILSNIIMDQLNEIIEFSLRKEGIPAKSSTGNYDNIVQDSLKYKDSNVIIIFWELCNFFEGFQYKIELQSDEQINNLLNSTIKEIQLVFNNLSDSSLVLFNKFSSSYFSKSNFWNKKIDNLVSELNIYLEENIPNNFTLIKIDNVIAQIGKQNSYDLRYYYTSKILYTNTFLIDYSSYVLPYIFAITGKVKKALIFDCDNTLWKGILGEDGFNGIEMSERSKEGIIFSEIQSIAKSLIEKGILIGICSKNNYEDVLGVLESHPDMILKPDDFTIMKINWNNKLSNLIEISKELNIALDSIVFIDDSSFEVNLIREKLTQVKVLQVPEKLYEYPSLLRDNIGLFYNFTLTKEDTKRSNMYKIQRERENEKSNFLNLEEYLISMDISVLVHEDEKSLIPRISQMTQKTNQFNLTTHRYTESDISKFISSNKYFVFSISVSDRFGDNGVTGLCIIEFDKKNSTAYIDTFLMSCRIIGRNIEYVFLDYIINKLDTNYNIKFVESKYIRTIKNDQVSNFYEDCSFTNYGSIDLIKKYKLKIDKYFSKKIDYIAIYEKKDNI